jgi:hypothetical protein
VFDLFFETIVNKKESETGKKEVACGEIILKVRPFCYWLSFRSRRVIFQVRFMIAGKQDTHGYTVTRLVIVCSPVSPWKETLHAASD